MVGAGDGKEYARMRERMVTAQIADRGIDDSLVLAAMRAVPRHAFVPDKHRNDAYEDYPLPIAEGQTISQPYVVAFMTAALGLDSTSRVLEVGTGSGYQAAVLAEICDSVYTIEIFESLGRSADSLLQGLGYDNIAVRVGDGYQGWPSAAPFDAIIVTCAPTHVPEPLQEQLAEGGRMIIPVGERFTQQLVLLTKRDGVVSRKDVLPVRFVPMLKDGGGKY
ncbi:MAG: protein-L-isoaspartate(D-aspartate) O-methyltransferase [Chitinivibrionales bacterium]|nr:protein-L-isoaspartate(D-aspartate) O-methyltransferase [Chitinivibrionales bacterium]